MQTVKTYEKYNIVSSCNYSEKVVILQNIFSWKKKNNIAARYNFREEKL